MSNIGHLKWKIHISNCTNALQSIQRSRVKTPAETRSSSFPVEKQWKQTVARLSSSPFSRIYPLETTSEQRTFYLWWSREILLPCVATARSAISSTSARINVSINFLSSTPIILFRGMDISIRRGSFTLNTSYYHLWPKQGSKRADVTTESVCHRSRKKYERIWWV